MKLLNITFILLLFLGIQTNAQRIGDLNGISYQAVAIDDEGKELVGIDISGKPLYEKEIGVKFSIHKGMDGELQYQEIHTVLTDAFGLFSLIIGHGDQTGSGIYTDLLSIPWIDADQWLKVEISTKNDGNYKTVGYELFMAVPYAFYTDDIADDAITTEKILNETILAEDIAEGAVTSSKILNETILAEDIAESAVTTTKILDETILAEDIAEGAVTSLKILNETILAEDIAEGAVTSSKILNETILAEDIAEGAVTTSKILNSTILNEDIADNTINLKTKVTDTLSVQNGGTGLGYIPKDNLLVGSGSDVLDTLAINDYAMVFSNNSGTAELYKLRAGLRATLEVDEANKTILIHAVEQGGGPDTGGGSVTTGLIPNGAQVLESFSASVVVGDIVLVTADSDLQGITMTAYVSTDGLVSVVLYNGTGADLDLGTINLKIANFGQ